MNLLDLVNSTSFYRKNTLKNAGLFETKNVYYNESMGSGFERKTKAKKKHCDQKLNSSLQFLSITNWHPLKCLYIIQMKDSLRHLNFNYQI